MRNNKGNYLTNINNKKYTSIKKKVTLKTFSFRKKYIKVCITTIMSAIMIGSITIPYVVANSESDADFTKAESNKEKDVKIAEYCSKANLYADRFDYKSAIDYLSKAINLKSDDGKLYYSRAAFFAEIKDYNKAIEDYQNVIKYDPSNVKVYFMLANLFYNVKDFDKACVYYTKALPYNSKEEVFFPLANAYMQEGKYEYSIKYLNEYIKLEKSNKKEAIYSRAIAYLLTEKYEDAIKDLKESILLKYNINMCNLYMAKCYYGMEIYNEAISYFEKYFKKCPKDYKEMSSLAVCYYNCSKLDKAKEWFNKCLNNKIDTEVSNYYLGVICLEKKSYQDSITYFNSCLEAEYRQEYCLYNRGVAYLYSSENEKAKNDFQKVLKISKDKELINMVHKALACL